MGVCGCAGQREAHQVVCEPDAETRRHSAEQMEKEISRAIAATLLIKIAASSL